MGKMGVGANSGRNPSDGSEVKLAGFREQIAAAFDRSSCLGLLQVERVTERAIGLLAELPIFQQHLGIVTGSLSPEEVRGILGNPQIAATLFNALKHSASNESGCGPVGLQGRIYSAAGVAASGFLRYLEEEAPTKLVNLDAHRVELGGQVTGILAALIVSEKPDFGRKDSLFAVVEAEQRPRYDAYLDSYLSVETDKPGATDPQNPSDGRIDR